MHSNAVNLLIVWGPSINVIIRLEVKVQPTAANTQKTKLCDRSHMAWAGEETKQGMKAAIINVRLVTRVSYQQWGCTTVAGIATCARI